MHVRTNLPLSSPPRFRMLLLSSLFFQCGSAKIYIRLGIISMMEWCQEILLSSRKNNTALQSQPEVGRLPEVQFKTQNNNSYTQSKIRSLLLEVTIFGSVKICTLVSIRNYTKIYQIAR